MRIFGIDPGSARTGYGCIDTDGSRCRLVVCGAVAVPARTPFPDKLTRIYDELASLLATHRPAWVAIEDVFYARNARSALKLGHVRGVAILAASKAGLPVAEYAPTEVKSAVVGYGRADKNQVQQMIALLLGLEEAPSPYDVSDALAIAVCHAHTALSPQTRAGEIRHTVGPRSWRNFRPQG
ncbi:MAG: crossover junction endodeoxyribonuclease RuvC [Vicinamibacterales bacterium]|nr:crossover junction endodeoxyribonuclease RuvC [Vicinamibacterales bacterium]